MKKPDLGQRMLIGQARFPKLAKLLCKIFGHKSTYFDYSIAKQCSYVCERCLQRVIAQSEFSKKYDGDLSQT